MTTKCDKCLIDMVGFGGIKIPPFDYCSDCYDKLKEFLAGWNVGEFDKKEK